VSIKLGGSTITTIGATDAAGNFLVNLSIAGPQVFLIDGSTANTSTVSYPTIPVTVNIQAGVVNTLGYTPHLMAMPRGKTIPLLSGQETVLAPAEIPGLEVRIPAGTTIIGWDGQPNTEIGVIAVPADRSGAPPIPGGQFSKTIYAYTFGKVGGGTPSQPVPITYPNDLQADPGEQVDLYFFDEAPDGSRPNAWAKYGTGTVSSDGTQIVPDIDPSTGKPYGVPRFCCGYNRAARRFPPADRNRGPYDAPVKGGEPVDLQTGLFVLDKTDLVLPGIVPLVVARTYRTNSSSLGPFGIGTSWTYDLFLTPPPNGSPDQLRLLLPGGSDNPFIRQPDGSFVNTISPIFRGARITVEADLRVLRFKDGTTWRFRTSDGLLLSQTDRNGNTLTIFRDPSGRVRTLSTPGGRSLDFIYNSTTIRIDRIDDPLGRQVRYSYDAQGRLETVTDPAGGITRYTYDANHRLLTITDPRGITFLNNEYDSAGRVVKQTQADGGTFTFAYTVSGGFITATKVIDPRGNPTTSRFNNFGYLIQQTDALGQTTTFERQPGSNLLLSTTDPLGRVTRFAYDASGNVTTITDPLGNARNFTYDPVFNKVTSVTDPLGNLTRFEFDPANGNLLKIIDPLGNTTTIAYNAFGQPISTVDPLGNSTTFEYDSVGNLVKVADPLGNATTRTYDAVSRLIAQADPLGKTTRFSYDPLNRLVNLVDALNGTTSFGYDPNGNLLTVTDARGNTITHEYDSMDRLLKRIDQLGRPETFSYDGNGNLVSTTDRKTQTTTFTYDPLNRRTQASYADGAVATFTYDAGGRLLQADDTADPHRPIALQYDGLDRLLAETTSLGTVSYQYDPLGRRTHMTVGGQSPVTYAYDAASRLRTITQAPLTPVDIQYDALGRRTLLTLPNGVSTEYVYDLGSRLTALVYRNALGPLGDLTYQYDSAGNRVGVGGSFARTLLPDPVPSATYDAANRQLAFGTKTMTFDDNGSLTTLAEPAGTTTFTWDTRNRLVSMSSPSQTASFTYDAQGRRARRTVGSVTTQFQYDGLDAIREVGGAGDASYLGTLKIDEKLTRTDTVGVIHFLADSLGSTVALANTAGDPTTIYTYEAYGRTVVDGAAENPIQFTGRENDSSGLYYYRERYYAPALARFIAQDAIGIQSGVNRYAYVGGSPLNYVDPLGLFRVRIHDIGGRQGPPYGATVVVESEDGTKSVTVPGSSWPNPNNPNPGIAPGTYEARYSQTGHKGQEPGIRLRDGGPIPTVGPNPNQGNQAYSTGINIHCGWSGTWRGSAGCITIHPDYCQNVWDILNQNERGRVRVNRNERPGF
jgi:RHS repeat-associated protein